jgi:hypothetical protein
MKTIFVVYIALIVLAMSACQKKSDSNNATVPAMGTDCVNNSSVCQTNLYQQNQGFYNYNQNYNSATMNNLCSCPYGAIPTYNNYAGLGCVDSNLIYGGGYNNSGYNSGYNGGYNPGYNSGYNSGYGYNGGYGGGLSGQYNSGYNGNYNSGYNSGYNNGYNGGYGGGASANLSINLSIYAYYGWGQSNSQWTNIPQISNVDSNQQTNSSCYNGVIQSCVVEQVNTCTAGFTCRPTAASSRLGLCTSNTTNTNSGQSYR